MSVRQPTLGVGDVVLLQPTTNTECIGLIKYVGPMVDHDVMSNYIGLELLEAIPNGHNGTIDSFTYFTAPKGHGFHTKITNVIKKLSLSDLFRHYFKYFKESFKLFQTQSKRISKLKTMLHNAREQCATPPPIDTNLPALTPGVHSNHSMESRQSLRSRVSTMSPIPTATAYKMTFQNIALNTVNTRVNPRKKRLSKTRHRGSVQSSVSPKRSSQSSSNASEAKPEIRHRRKHSKHRRKKSKHKHKQQTLEPKRHKRRSQSTLCGYDKYPLVEQRQRANTTDLNYDWIGNALCTNNQNMKRLPMIQQRSNYMYTTNKQMVQTSENMLMPQPRSSSLILSRSAPSSPYNGPTAAPSLPYNGSTLTAINVIPNHNGQYLEPKLLNHTSIGSVGQYLDPNTGYAMNNMALAQSNTQLYGDEDIHYNVQYSPSYSMSNVNGAYSPYQYKDQNGSNSMSYHQIQSETPPQNYEQRRLKTRTKSASPYQNRPVSPYRTRLAQFNEYYRNNNMATSPVLQPMQVQNHRRLSNIVYQIHENGMVYEHGNH